jgi:hypothetical protein
VVIVVFSLVFSLRRSDCLSPGDALNPMNAAILAFIIVARSLALDLTSSVTNPQWSLIRLQLNHTLRLLYPSLLLLFDPVSEPILIPHTRLFDLLIIGLPNSINTRTMKESSQTRSDELPLTPPRQDGLPRTSMHRTASIQQGEIFEMNAQGTTSNISDSSPSLMEECVQNRVDGCFHYIRTAFRTSNCHIPSARDRRKEYPTDRTLHLTRSTSMEVEYDFPSIIVLRSRAQVWRKVFHVRVYYFWMLF